MSCISGVGSSNAKRRGGELALPPQDNVSSVATVILNNLLNNVSDENEKLGKENKTMEQVRSVLTNINIHLGDIDDYDIVAKLELGNGVIIDEKSLDIEEKDGKIYNRVLALPFHKIPPNELVGYKLLFSMKDAVSIPLSDLMEIKVTMIRVGDFLGIHNEVFIDGGDVTLTLQLSEDITMQGEITGLCHEDIERFRVGKMIDDEEGDNSVARMIMKYLNVGTGLASDPENVEFTPFGFHMIITPNMKKILDVLRPMCCESPGESSLFKEKFDASRFDVITAIGGNDTQKKVLEENKKLVVENIALKALCDIMGTIEIHHSAGTFSIPLKEGTCGVVTNDNRLVWIVDLSEKDISVAAKDICECGAMTLSGVPMHLVPPVIMRPNDDDVDLPMGIQLRYDNQTVLHATVDSAIDEGGFLVLRAYKLTLIYIVSKEVYISRPTTFP